MAAISFHKVAALPSTPIPNAVYFVASGDFASVFVTDSAGVARPVDGTGYVFTQVSPALTWTVNHNMGRKPAVSVLSVGGVEIVAAVSHISSAQAVIEFSSPTAGQAILT